VGTEKPAYSPKCLEGRFFEVRKRFCEAFVKLIADSSRLGLLGAESDLSLVGAYGYEAERNRGPTALLVLVLVLVASDGSPAVPPTKVMVPVPRGLGKGPMP
jgi:hypothetical protein